MAMAQPADVAIFAAAILVAMPPEPTGRGGSAAHGLDFGRDLAHLGDQFRGGIAVRVGRVQARDIGQQQQAVRAGHLRHARREPVVVAVTDLRGRHRVVLVDHRQRAELEQLGQRGARIEIAAAVLAVFER
jgi:hypothetical protein